jgi:O-antigen/teichoic acid export membrane protein
MLVLSSGLCSLFSRLGGLENNDPLKRLVRGASWSLLGTIFAQIITLGTSIPLARILGAEAFGQYALITTTVLTLSTFVGFGLGQTATKYLSEFKTTDPVFAANVLSQARVLVAVCSAVGWAMTFFSAEFLASVLLKQPSLGHSLKIASFVLALTAVGSTQHGALAGFEAFPLIAAIAVFRALINTSLALILTPAWGLHGAIWAGAGAMLLTCLISEVCLAALCRRHAIKFSLGLSAKSLNVLWRYSVPALLSSVTTSVAALVAMRRLAVSPSGLAEVAVFNVANQWRLALLFVPGLIGQVILPILCSIQGEDKLTAQLRILKTAVLANFVVSSCALLCVSLLSGAILKAYGSAFEGRQDVMIVLLVSAVLLACQTPVGNYIASSSAMWVGFSHNLGWGLCLTATTHYLLELDWGAQALACGYLLAYAVHGAWTGAFALSLSRRESV